MSTVRRDRLRAIQEAAQERWQKGKVFEVDAPFSQTSNDVTSKSETSEKYFGTFPYPYMNGVLHLGHAFSLSKVEFATAYQRLCGKCVLFPQGFHCTGMPIQACADRLADEIEVHGMPPMPSKLSGPMQWSILLESGIPAEDIPLFRSADHWLRHFPPLAREHLVK
jgi:leucyl-tRNA synthetase